MKLLDERTVDVDGTSVTFQLRVIDSERYILVGTCTPTDKGPRVELLVSDFEVAVDRIAFSDQELTKIWQRALARQQLTHVQSSRLPDPKPVPVVFPDGTERLGLEIEDGLLEVASAPETMQTQRLVLLIGGERRLVRAIRNQLRNGELTARIRHEKAP